MQYDNIKRFRRKRNRLTDYDYSDEGVYFVTVCTAYWKELFWANPWKMGVEECIALQQRGYVLTELGELVEQSILNILKFYVNVTIESFVIMPNHYHMLIRIKAENASCDKPANLSRIIQNQKMFVTKQYGESVWQKSFHDHIVKDKRKHKILLDYITANPFLWEDDGYHPRNLERTLENRSDDRQR